jgi:hypothetical protein
VEKNPTVTVVTPILHKLSSGPDPEVKDLDEEIESLKKKLSELEAERARVSLIKE